MQETPIGWTDWSANLLRYLDPDGNIVHACVRISEGCRFCYSCALAGRWGRKGKDFTAENMKSLTPFFDIEGAQKLLRSRKITGQKVFIDDMTDLFGDWVSDEIIDQHFAIFALRPDVTFQVLTKRAERMRNYLANPATPGRVAKASDCIAVAEEIAAMGPEEIRPIQRFPGYFITDRGRVLSSSGSGLCLFCGDRVNGIATKAYCNKTCRANAYYYRKTGRSREGQRTPVEMSPDVGEMGHARVMLYRDGQTFRELVHRLVLETFVRGAEDGEEGCHQNGDATINALPNLRWGTRSSNLSDRVRHGNGRSWSKLTDAQAAEIRASRESIAQLASRFLVSGTTISNILNERIFVGNRMEWPLPNCHAGVSVEDQKTADERIPLLLETPAAVRWVSVEPLLNPANLNPYLNTKFMDSGCYAATSQVNWIVVGGESGAGHREMPIVSAVNLAREAHAVGASVFIKQDSGPRPGMQGRWPDDLWALKEQPEAKVAMA